MAKSSAGLLMFRRSSELEVLLVHLGGPFWAKKDDGAWFVPKGEIEPGEEVCEAAKREFREETGFEPQGPFLPLGSVRNKSGKTVTVWAFESDCDPTQLRSNTFRMEWPPRSGKMAEFREVDRAAFFTIAAARKKMNSVEGEFLSRLERQIKESLRAGGPSGEG
jgi:predicted NUDIX family NTP pyrophosphohydrolase